MQVYISQRGVYHNEGSPPAGFTCMSLVNVNVNIYIYMYMPTITIFGSHLRNEQINTVQPRPDKPQIVVQFRYT